MVSPLSTATVRPESTFDEAIGRGQGGPGAPDRPLIAWVRKP
jgi:hypothetical protein